MRTKWEYWQAQAPTMDDLNALGAEGWELVAALKVNNSLLGATVVVLMKRPVEKSEAKT